MVHTFINNLYIGDDSFSNNLVMIEGSNLLLVNEFLLVFFQEFYFVENADLLPFWIEGSVGLFWFDCWAALELF
jgi:hypothetical protein